MTEFRASNERATPVFRRIRNWLGKSSDHRALSMRSRMQVFWGNVFRSGLSKGRILYLAYQPDSYYLGLAHREFDDLFCRFTLHNRHNNGGDIPRLWTLILNCKQINSENIPGDFAELGVWRGNSAAILANYAEPAGRSVYLFDTYEGFSGEDLRGIDADKLMAFGDTSIELVRGVVGTSRTNCHYVKGRFPGSVEPLHRSRQYSLVSIDCDLYEPMRAALEFFYARMPRGGMLLLHDYSSLQWNGAKRAIDEFCAESGEFVILMPDKSGSACLRRTREPAASA